MKHKFKLSRKKSYRHLLLRNLATSIILYERIKTTPSKAKAVRPLIEKMINLGKSKKFSDHKKLFSFFLDKNAPKKILEDLTPKFKNKKSGYLRILHLGYRAGDSAPQVLVELILPEDLKTKEVGAVKTTIRAKKGTLPKKIEIKKAGWLEKIKDKLPQKASKAAKTVITKRTTQK